jgi:hypothetical protein
MIGEICLLIGILVILAVIVYIAYREDIKTIRKIRKRLYETRDCSVCKHCGTMNCPNSSLCWSTSDKPYFEPKEEDEQK